MADELREKIINIILKVAMAHHDDISAQDEYKACEAADEIKALFKSNLPKFHKTIGGYKEFEKYTECEHKKNDEIGSNCQSCDIAWLIARCKVLERTLTEIEKIVEEI